MTEATDALALELKNYQASANNFYNKPLWWNPPTLVDPVVYDFNPPTAFNGTPPPAGRIYAPAGSDMSWLPAGVYTVSYYAAGTTVIYAASNTVYVFGDDTYLNRIIADPLKDLRIVLSPTQVRVMNTFQVTGGRNVQVIGGSLRGNTDAAGSIRTVLKFSGQSQSVYCEGLIVDANNQNGLDCIEVGNAGAEDSWRPDAFVQNCHLKNANSTTSGFHSDCFQYYGSTQWTFMDRVSCTSSYQALFLDQQAFIDGIVLHDVDTRYINPNDRKGYSYYLHSSTAWAPNEEHKPVYQLNVWVQPGIYSSSFTEDVNWRNFTLYPPGNVGAWSNVATADGKRASFPYFPVFGYVNKGVPPQGQFCPESRVGLGYVSPGYMTKEPFPINAERTMYTLPGGFAWTPSFELYKKHGEYQTNYDHVPNLITTGTLKYVNPAATGTGDGSSAANGMPTIQAAIDAGANRIWLSPGFYDLTSGAFDINLPRDTYFYGNGLLGEIIWATSVRNPTWAQDPSYVNVYKTTVTNPQDVVDQNWTRAAENEYLKGRLIGVPKQYTPVASVAACQALAGSYYISGSDVYVHTFDNRVPDTSIRVLTTRNIFATTDQPYKLMMYNIDMWGNQGFAYDGTTVNSLAMAIRCGFRFSKSANGAVWIKDNDFSYLLSCAVSDCNVGINYQNTIGTRLQKALEWGTDVRRCTTARQNTGSFAGIYITPSAITTASST